MSLFVSKLSTSRRSWAALSAYGICLIGGLALLGWRFDVILYRSVLSGLPSMSSATALAFILSGAALRLSVVTPSNRWPGFLVQALGFIVAVVGFLGMGEALFGWDPGFSLRVLSDRIAPGPPTSQMAATTALNFLMLGLAIILQGDPAGRGRRLAEGFIYSAGLISLVGIIGFIHSNEYSYHFSMALNTASTFFLLCLGLFSARPDYETIELFLGPDLGGYMARRLVPAALVIPVFLDWVRAAGQKAGWYDAGTGAAAFTTLLIVIILGFILWISITLDRIDAERRSKDDRLRESRRELSDQTRVLKSVLSSMGEGVIVSDMNGKFLIWNPAAENLIKMGSAEVSPQDAERYGLFQSDRVSLYPVDQLPLLKAIRGLSVDSEEIFVRNPLMPKGGWISVTGRPLKDESGTLLGGVIVFNDITERKRFESELSGSQEQIKLLLDSTVEAIYGIDLQGHCTLFNTACLRILGYAAGDDLIGKNMHDLMHHSRSDGSPYPLTDCRIIKAFQEEKGTHVADEVLWRADGSCFPAEYRSYPMRKNGAVIGAVVTFIDITDRKRTESEMLRTHAQLTALVRELEDRKREMSIISEMGDLLQTCHSLQEAADVTTRSLRLLFPAESGGLYTLMASRNLLELTGSWGTSPPEERLFPPEDCWALRKGKVHQVDDSISGLICPHVKQPVSNGNLCIPMQAQSDVVGVLQIILSKTDEMGASDKDKGRLDKNRGRLAAAVAEHIGLALANIKLGETLRNQAIRDSLTGLYNRRYLQEILHKEIGRAERSRQRIGVIMIDIDHFKRFNDVHGHEAGDAVLSMLGKLLNEKNRGGDTACRYGGEEFTVVLPDTSFENALRKAAFICEEARSLKPVFQGRPLESITLSLGVAVYPDHGSTAKDLLRAADHALYQAKGEGRNRVVGAQIPEGYVQAKEEPETGRGGRGKLKIL